MATRIPSPTIRVAVGLVLVVLALIITGFPSGRQAAAVGDPIYACAAKTNGQLRFVATPTCKRTETLINLFDLNDANGAKLCALTGTGQLRWIRDSASCKGNEFVVISPGESQLTFCVRKDNGATRIFDSTRGLPACDSATENEVVLPPRNQAPVANATSGTVFEDGGGITITLSATDADGDALQFSIVTGPTLGTLDTIISLSCTGGIPNSCTASVAYTPAADASGADSFTYKAQDPFSSSAAVTVSITIVPVNDAPDFVSGGNVTVAEDSAPYSATWATSITPGPANESGQLLTFTTSNNNPALFATAPAVAANGTLSFTPAANASGSATVSVFLSDNGGTGNGGVDTSPTLTFTITITPAQ